MEALRPPSALTRPPHPSLAGPGDNLMGSSSVVTQRAEEKQRREVVGGPTHLFTCVRAYGSGPFLPPGSVHACIKVAAGAAERQKPCCDLCGLRYERWLRSSKTSI